MLNEISSLLSGLKMMTFQKNSTGAQQYTKKYREKYRQLRKSGNENQRRPYQLVD